MRAKEQPIPPISIKSADRGPDFFFCGAGTERNPQKVG